jgi:hypothetical protein
VKPLIHLTHLFGNSQLRRITHWTLERADRGRDLIGLDCTNADYANIDHTEGTVADDICD